ncbi:hypothetical protein BTHERMOSOX_367 [Bathymodiolus thermophilus thioautotrophic gill symbiont]|nr:hypothetical protein THERMOT_1412 [Bathymodiolus thermophilus thioautotrophic gill symbiont]SHA10533.1 hypothetical protein BTHERMOSOX_367 [Bathymodiolus thermophilus thioautotrophic gill symbiont]
MILPNTIYLQSLKGCPQALIYRHSLHTAVTFLNTDESVH